MEAEPTVNAMATDPTTAQELKTLPEQANLPCWVRPIVSHDELLAAIRQPVISEPLGAPGNAGE